MAEALRVPGGRAAAGKGNFSRNVRARIKQIKKAETLSIHARNVPYNKTPERFDMNFLL
ncbi:MAG: hypothetical protein IJ189_12450 [Clostridia bacterium]|nr:hypothetical protein [Clostridia bacterium]